MTISVIGLIIGGISAGQQQRQASSARRQQRNQLATQKNIQAEELRKSRIESRRRARAAQAQIIASGEGAGAAGSSAVAGGVSAVASTGAAQQSYLTRQSASQGAIVSAQEREVEAGQKASLWGTVGSLAQTAGTMYGSFTKPATKPKTS